MGQFGVRQKLIFVRLSCTSIKISENPPYTFIDSNLGEFVPGVLVKQRQEILDGDVLVALRALDWQRVDVSETILERENQAL
jgi:hypothetical protein